MKKTERREKGTGSIEKRGNHFFLRSGFQTQLETYAKKQDESYIRGALQLLTGFMAHYGRIPGYAVKEIKAIKRWCQRKWDALCGNCDESYQQWFFRVAKT